ncbi:MAG: DMT family transporter [Prochlorothrix sp.]
MQSSHPPTGKIILILSLGILAIATAPILIRLAMATIVASDITASGVNAGAAPALSKRSLALVMAASRLLIVSVILAPNWRTLSRQHYPRSLRLLTLVAGLCLALHFATWISSLAYTSIAASTVIVTTNPIWVALLSRFWWQERLRPLTWIGIGLALAGSLTIGLAEAVPSVAPQPLLGNGFALIGSWTISLYLVLGRHIQTQGVNTAHYTTAVYTVAALGLLPVPWLQGTGYGGYPMSVYGYIVLMALLPQLVGHTSLNWAVRWLSPTLVTLAVLGEPIGASLLGYWILDEVPTVTTLGGGAIVLLGIGLAAWGQRSSAPA